MHQRRWQNSCVILDSLREVVLSDHDYVESSHSDPPFTWGCPPKTSKVEKYDWKTSSVILNYWKIFLAHARHLPPSLGGHQEMPQAILSGSGLRLRPCWRRYNPDFKLWSCANAVITAIRGWVHSKSLPVCGILLYRLNS